MRKSSSIPMNFNSHAHVERDFADKYGERDFYISTHTLTWSVTSQVKDTAYTDAAFQLTRSRGA